MMLLVTPMSAQESVIGSSVYGVHSGGGASGGCFSSSTEAVAAIGLPVGICAGPIYNALGIQ